MHCRIIKADVDIQDFNLFIVCPLAPPCFAHYENRCSLRQLLSTTAFCVSSPE